MSHHKNGPPPPPFTVVTTSSSSTSSHRREQKITTPTILVKPPSSAPSTDVKNVGAYSSSGGSNANANANANAYNHNHNNNHNRQQQQQNFTTEKDDKEIDPALLSALRDNKRERMALLRLERCLIDFMNDKTCGFMDVGGPMNSTVIKGTSSTAGGTAAGDSNSSSNSASAVDGANSGVNGGIQHPQQQMLLQQGGMGMPVNMNMNMGMGMNVSMSMNNYSNNMDNGREGKQTSFQRLCLHRLADRFNIVRQTNTNNNSNNHNMHCGGGHRHLIRLIKVKESRIPTLKLINVNMADYETTSIPQDRGVGGGVEEVGASAGGVKGITSRLSGTHLDSYGNNSSTHSGSGSSGKKSKKKEKVKIMKRAPNNNKHLNKSADSEKSKRKGKKNLSDKEKAYAEARARIFNTTQESNTSSNHLDISDHAANSANSTIIDTSADVDSSAPALDSTISADSGSSDRNMSPVSSQLNNSSEILDEGVDDTAKNVPAAAKGGAESKVLWRNRQKEAIDPDFRRAHHPIMVQQPVNGNLYAQPHYPQPNQIMVQQSIAFGHTHGHGHGGHGGYHYQPSMDPMSYSRPGQHSYYQQPNDVSWQRQENTSIHQMQNNVPYGVYAQHAYDDNTATNGGRTNQNQQPPAYTEEEFPALA